MAAAVAIVPLRFGLGFSCGHDFDFHLSSWFDALHSWRQGILYPHWASSANFFAGEPRFVFYPPMTWMLGAALHTLFLWRHVPIALSFLLLFGIGVAVRKLALEAMSDAPATLAGCFAMFSAYALFTVYERSDYAELAGGIWIALLLMLMLRDLRQPAEAQPRLLDGRALPLGIVVAGAWLSNPTVGVMASYLLAALALWVAALRRSWVPTARAAIAAALGLGLSAFYWLPAWWEEQWIAIRQAVSDPGERIENSFLFARHSGLELHDIELMKVSAIVVFMVGLSVLALLIAWRRRGLSGARRWWIVLALIPPAVLLLQLPFSLPLWNVLPELRFLQFPWRWLVAVEAPMAVLLAAAVWPRSRRAQVWVGAACALFFVVSAGFAGIAFHQDCDPDDAVLGMAANYAHHVGFEGTDEYAPRGAENDVVATGLPDACLVADPNEILGGGDPDLTPEWSADQKSCIATYGFEDGNAEHRRVQAAVPHAGYLVLRLRRYAAWRVQVNGRPAGVDAERKDGLMAVAVPQGPVKLTVDWGTTPDVLAARWISGLSLLAGLGLWLLERRRLQARLK
ncbi:MAG: hypothetical protein ACLGSD_14425 [Acidobacteriota bacterium]